MNTQPENFNDFIVKNSKQEAKVIRSIRGRLLEYGTSILRRDVEGEMKDRMGKNPKRKNLMLSLKDKGIHPDNPKIIQGPLNKYELGYLLRAEDDKGIMVGIDFNPYNLCWEIFLYSKKPMLKWMRPDEKIIESFDPQNNLVIGGCKILYNYAKERGVVIDNDYQKYLSNINTEDKVLSIVAIEPTGDRVKDVKKIADTLEEIIFKLLGEETTDSHITDSPSKSEDNYAWEELLAGYKKEDLFEPPTRIRTFLEIAGIADKEIYISNVMAFLLDENEPHPFGNIFARSLCKLYMDKGGKGLGDRKKSALSANVKEVHTEYSTANRKRIDLLVETDKYVMAIEHKISAELYNNLESYRTKANELANKDKDNVKGVACIVLCPFTLSTTDAKKADKYGFISINYQELFDEVTNHFNEVKVYHQDKHFLYMQLFYDLFRTIENLTDEKQCAKKFEEFMSKDKHAHWSRQAVHKLVAYRNSVLDYVKNKAKEELNKEFVDRYEEKDNAKGRDGKEYLNKNEGYMITRSLVYQTTHHNVDKNKSKLSMDVDFDWTRGQWRVVHGISEQEDTNSRCVIWLEPQGTKEATEELITKTLVYAIRSFEGIK